jgi:hypothetical protein
MPEFTEAELNLICQMLATKSAHGRLSPSQHAALISAYNKMYEIREELFPLAEIKPYGTEEL